MRFGDVNNGNINLLKCLNDVTLPVKYSRGFYTKMLGYQRYSKLGKRIKSNKIKMEVMVSKVNMRMKKNY